MVVELLLILMGGVGGGDCAAAAAAAAAAAVGFVDVDGGGTSGSSCSTSIEILSSKSLG